MTTSKLRQEIGQKPEGVYAPEFFKAAGFREMRGARVSAARAQAVRHLLSDPQPYIYKNDLIAGSIRPLVIRADDRAVSEARNLCSAVGERGFLTNFDHYAPDYRKLVTVGLPGLLLELDASLRAHAGNGKKTEYLTDMKTALSGLGGMIRNYAQTADALIGADGYSDSALAAIRDHCRKLLSGAPQSFEEALQLVWLTHLSFVYEGRYAMALGRMDQYLYPLFVRDIEKGILDEERAVTLLENVFMKLYERHVILGGDDVVNICIGGQSREGKCEVNRLSFCVLDAVKNCQIPGPNLSARLPADVSDEFLDECLKSIGTGLGYPALMNDDINIAALGRHGYAPQDLYDYCMVGCIENFIPGKQPPWSDGRFDTPRYFEYLFNRGKAIRYPADGIDTGPLGDIRSMDDLMQKYEEQLRCGVKLYVENFNRENSSLDPETFTSPYLSCFCDCCIARGLDINNGGAKYKSAHGVGLMGIGTVCDSLAAIETVVFTEHAASLADIRDAMLRNFDGYETLRDRLLDAPKYGNNLPAADKYAVWFVDFFYNEFGKYRTPDGGPFYLAMAANTNNISAGSLISATPDGRKAGEPLSDAASPTYGRDIRGATSLICSVTRPDYTKVACGTVINQKYSPSMFGDGRREKLRALLRVYLRKGGQEIQINATSRAVLEDAMEHPEKYPTMVVRVSGYSAIFVTLPRAVQLDILSRTQQN